MNYILNKLFVLCPLSVSCKERFFVCCTAISLNESIECPCISNKTALLHVTIHASKYDFFSCLACEIVSFYLSFALMGKGCTCPCDLIYPLLGPFIC